MKSENFMFYLYINITPLLEFTLVDLPQKTWIKKLELKLIAITSLPVYNYAK
jgi:hypothetical protein